MIMSFEMYCALTAEPVRVSPFNAGDFGEWKDTTPSIQGRSYRSVKHNNQTRLHYLRRSNWVVDLPWYSAVFGYDTEIQIGVYRVSSPVYWMA